MNKMPRHRRKNPRRALTEIEKDYLPNAPQSDYLKLTGVVKESEVLLFVDGKPITPAQMRQYADYIAVFTMNLLGQSVLRDLFSGASESDTKIFLKEMREAGVIE